jgi:hypothetical protein
MTRSTIQSALAATVLAALMAGPVAGQAGSPDPTPAGVPIGSDVIEVVGVEYAYVGLPSSVPVGTSLAFDNTGLEFHELALARVADDATESFEELMALGDAAFGQGKLEIVEEGVLIANPQEKAEGTLALEREGRYLAICLVPQGMIPSLLSELGVTEDMAPVDWPPEAQAILENPTHATLGMVQEFAVTPAPSEPGEVPEVDEAR